MTIGNIHEKLDSFDEYWSPKVIAQLNGQHVRVAKLFGEFQWHCHENEDEMFLIIRGNLSIHFKKSVQELREGDFLVIPKGVSHKPVAEKEVEVLLFEPAETINTGNIFSEKTKAKLDII